MPPAFYDDLPQTLRACWTLLERGAADRRSAFHTLAAATTGLDGRPRVRTVVSRRVDPPARAVRFHADSRSAKVAELRADPRLALLGYDPGAKIQLRLEGTATLHTEGPVADEAWAGSPPASRICYGTAPAPGEPVAQGGGFALPASPDEVAAGRENFCAVLVTVERLEFLYLALEGHRRARFSWDRQRAEAEWLVP
jgi:hypothetical protein